MAKTLYELAMEYLNQGMPDITQTPRTITPGTPSPVTVPSVDPNASTARILPIQGGGGGGGGGGNNVYNSDPNSTRTQSNYNERPYKSASYKNSFPMMGDPMANQATGALNANGLMSYAGDKPLEGIPGAIADYAKNSIFGKGLSALGDKLPVNRRAILENELLGSGMQLNDIGQFVSDGGDINKADGSNIMAGYNASKVTQDTFDKRRDTINAKMKDPVQKAEKLAALDAAEKSFFGAKTKADFVFDNKSLEKDSTYKSLADKIATENSVNLEKENDEDGKASYYDPLNQIDSMPSFTGFNAPSTFTLTAPQYGTSFGQGYGSGYGPGDGTGSGGSYDEAGIDYGDGTGSGGSYDEAGIDYGDGTGSGGSYDEAGVNTGLSYNQGGGSDGSYDEAGINTGSSYNAGSGYNATGLGGPAGQGTITNPSNYGTGTGNLGDYQMQSSQPEAAFEDQSYSPPAPSYTPSPGDGGEGGNSGGGGKIVCTMMNESYGFGSFRNKIWMKFHKDLAPEYQKGYHKIFLPLIKIAKRNKIVKKVLEHIAIHSTIDMRQATRGKTHLLGRVI